MASTDKPVTEPEKVAPPPESATAVEAPAAEPEKVVDAPVAEPEKVPPPLEEGSREVAPPTPRNYFVVAEVVLRFLLFAASVTAVVVLVTSDQTEIVPLPFPPFRGPREAKFSHSPAFIYFLAALSLAGLYSIITTAVSFLAILKPACSSTKLQLHFVIFDVLLLGIVAAATGVAGGVGYIGLKGNSHVGWNKICGIYDVFCRHVAASVAASLFASVVLVLIVLLSVYSLSKKIPK